MEESDAAQCWRIHNFNTSHWNLTPVVFCVKLFIGQPNFCTGTSTADPKSLALLRYSEL